jgi:hypothetical protein
MNEVTEEMAATPALSGEGLRAKMALLKALDFEPHVKYLDGRVLASVLSDAERLAGGAATIPAPSPADPLIALCKKWRIEWKEFGAAVTRQSITEKAFWDAKKRGDLGLRQLEIANQEAAKANSEACNRCGELSEQIAAMAPQTPEGLFAKLRHQADKIRGYYASSVQPDDVEEYEQVLLQLAGEAERLAG